MSTIFHSRLTTDLKKWGCKKVCHCHASVCVGVAIRSSFDPILLLLIDKIGTVTFCSPLIIQIAVTVALPLTSPAEPTVILTVPGVPVRTTASARPWKAWQRSEVY